LCPQNSDKELCHQIEICHRPKTKANPKCASMLRTQSATVLASAWQCQRCSHANDSAKTKNKKRCCSYQAWRDRIALLSAQAHGGVCNKAGGVGNVGSDTDGSVGFSFCSSENDSPNKASPCKVGTSQEKNGEKRKSPSRGNGDVAIRNTNDRRQTNIAIPTGKKMKRI
jgi:hypothetical protein